MKPSINNTLEIQNKFFLRVRQNVPTALLMNKHLPYFLRSIPLRLNKSMTGLACTPILPRCRAQGSEKVHK